MREYSALARFYLANGIEGVARGRPWVHQLVWRLEAALLALFWGLMGLLPVDWASAAGGHLFGAVGPRLRKSRPVRRNLEIAFPGLDADRREALVAGIWRETGRVIAEYPHLAKIRLDSPEPRLEVADNETLARLRERTTPTVFVTAHLANYELAACAVVQLGFPLSVISTALPNPFADRLWQSRRRMLGWRYVHKSASPFALARELREGRSLGLLLDHRVNGGGFAPFFGVDAETTLVPALLAARHGLDLTPVRVERLRGARFRVTFFEPIRPDPGVGAAREQAQDMTRRLFATFEDWIRERPGAWLCYKRRWPKAARPRVARSGAPIRPLARERRPVTRPGPEVGRTRRGPPTTTP